MAVFLSLFSFLNPLALQYFEARRGLFKCNSKILTNAGLRDIILNELHTQYSISLVMKKERYFREFQLNWKKLA